jgi:hypothetical protein
MRVYNIQNNIGRAKYVVNYHNGTDTHADGSPFYHIATFKNKVALNTFEQKLIEQGYQLK